MSELQQNEARTPLRWRFLKAHLTMVMIALSYGWVQLGGRFFRGLKTPARVEARHRRNALRVKRRILELRGLFIKVGQLISTLTNFLPEAFRGELEELQDRIPAAPYEVVREKIERELGDSITSLFARFDIEAIASASLAQVHRAQMADGREVAVKVQHPDIDEVARRDLKTIHSILRLVERFLGVRGLQEQYGQLREIVLEELDFDRERENLIAITENFAENPGVDFPRPVPERSGPRVLTTTFVEGVKASDLDGLAATGVDRVALAKRIIESYCRMIFVDGLYHADPHPGNLLVRPDGTLVFLDFGAVARLSPAMKKGIPSFLFSLLRKDVAGLRNALTEMGFIPRDGDQERAAEILDTFHERMFERMNFEAITLGEVDHTSSMEMKMEALADMQALDISFRELTTAFRVPKDWLMLERTTLLLIGLCTRLDPSLNPLVTIRPYLEENLLGGEINWREELLGSVTEAGVALLGLPQELRTTLGRATTGSGIRVEDRRLGEGVTSLARAVRGLTSTIFMLAGGAVLYSGYIRGDELLNSIGAGIIGVSIIWWMIRAR